MKRKIVLASASPRRLEIFNMFSLCPEVSVSDVDETLDREMTPDETVMCLSRRKGEAVRVRYPSSTLIVSADTVVSYGGKILGKPQDPEDAVAMLTMLSGTCHEVWTGYTVFCDGREVSRAVKTEVHFKPLTKEEICAYVETGESIDKAGAYGAQGKASVFVSRIDGDFFNVVGFPLSDFYDTVKKEFGIDLFLLTEPSAKKC